MPLAIMAPTVAMATWSSAAPPAGCEAAAAAEMKFVSTVVPPRKMSISFPLVNNQDTDRCNIARRKMPVVSEVTEAATAADQALTIDQLAQRTGMTVRNIRAHQSRGLLPPPEVRGRTGYYGEDHITRIELIQDLQADGFNL